MRARLLAGTAAGALALGLAATLTTLPASAATGSSAKLSVLHGVPDLTVDVWVDGERTIDDFTPGSLAGPLDLPAGTYSVAITAADATDASSAAIGPVDLTLAGGGNYTAVAHLDAAGSPTATLFTNDTSATPAGQGRLIVRHVAAAPAVDVLAGGQPVVQNLTNPNEQTLELPAGTVPATVVAAGTTEPAVLGPADVTVTEGADTIVYAWGSLADSNLALATQTIDGLHSGPSGVQAGQVGLAADEGSPVLPVALTMLVAGGMAVAGVAGVRVARRATARR